MSANIEKARANKKAQEHAHVLIQIADVPEEKGGVLEEIMRERDAGLNEIEEVTCRVWLLIVLKRLVKEGIVQCASGLGSDKVEEECMVIGNRFAEEAARNVQPRPVVKSRVSFGGED